MRSSNFKIVTLSLLVLLSFSVNAQNKSKRDYNTWSATLNFGPLLFYGDIKQYDWYPVNQYQSERKLGFGAAITKSFSPYFGLQGSVLRGNLAGTKREEGVYFNADLWEYTFSGIFYIDNLFYRLNPKPRKTSFYLTAGLGLVQFRSDKRTLSELDLRVASFGYEPGPTDRTTESVVPVGAGIKYKLTNSLDLGFEATMRFANTDKLDATVRTGSAKDRYSFTNLTLSYKFGKGKEAESIDRKNPYDELYEEMLSLRSKVDSLTRDGDKDGVPDLYDQEPSTAAGIAVSTRGTAVDTDGDEVPDHADNEPYSAKGAKVDIYGKEADTDKDGVPDSQDEEPNTKPGAVVNFKGITINKAPEEGGSSGGAVATGVSNMPAVYFSVNSTYVLERYGENLADVARILKNDPKLKVKIVGHTDPTASEEYNLRLGERRAQAVADYMRKNLRVPAKQMVVESKGESDVISPTVNRLNRRVEFIFVK